jgi:chromosome segregation ATPase
MSEDKTKETKDARSFEERVFARFDSSDERFDRVISAMDIRITKLERRQYDTKPIWERALAEIAETNRKIDLLQLAIEGLRQETNDSISGLRTDMNSEFAAVRQEMTSEFAAVRQEMTSEFAAVRQEMTSEFAAVRQEMKSEFAAVRQEMKHAFHGVGHKIDALNHNILQVQADQLGVDSRLRELESQVESP